jgi:SAM-dependent methyltransferase
MEKPHTLKTMSDSLTEKVLADDSLFSKDAFSRSDESDDSIFYATDRFVQHLDSLALKTVEKLIGDLVTEENPVILDLMSSWDSHIPSSLRPQRVVGLGLNGNELSKNPALTEWCLHDLNKNPILPFANDTFDVVLNVVSVDYMTKPFDVFREVNRILKKSGFSLQRKSAYSWWKSSSPGMENLLGHNCLRPKASHGPRMTNMLTSEFPAIPYTRSTLRRRVTLGKKGPGLPQLRHMNILPTQRSCRAEKQQ